MSKIFQGAFQTEGKAVTHHAIAYVSAKTGTFKIQKNDLRNDGVDPTTVDDPLYVRANGGYEPLTPERWTDVKEGRLKL